MKIRFLFAWYDFWVGLFWDSHKRRLYILPVPCFGVILDFDPIPKLNTRRIALIDKKYQGGLTESESAELADLQAKVFERMEARDPRSTNDLEARLQRLERIAKRIKEQKSRETPQQET